MKIFINILTRDSLKYLPLCLQAIFGQSVKDFSLVIVDNASTDGTAEYVRKNYPEATVLRNFNNRGGAVARNQALQLIKNKAAAAGLNFDEAYVLYLDSGIILPRDFIKCLYAAIGDDRDSGGFALKVLRLGTKDLDEPTPLGEVKETPSVPIRDFASAAIDSLGIGIGRSGSIKNLGAGTRDAGQFDETEEVFGPASALGLFRLAALEDAKAGAEHFDEDFFEGEEDIDIIWRMRLLGYKFYFLPSPHAFRFGAGGGGGKNIWQKIGIYRQKSATYLYGRNHLWLFVKNWHFVNLIICAPQIFILELIKFLHTLFFRPKNLKSYASFIRYLPQMIKKRFYIFAKGRMSAGEMRKLFRLC